MEHEVILKRLLLKIALEKELEDAIHGKISDEQQILLNYLADKIFMQFPPFQKYYKEHQQELSSYHFLPHYSKFVSITRLATRHDVGGFKHAASIFDVIFETPSEIDAQQESDISRGINEDKQLMEGFTIEQVIGMFADILRETLSSSEGARSVMDTIRKSKTLHDLPEAYQRIFTFVHEHWAPKLLIQSLDTPSKVTKWKTVYHLAPRRAIKGVLKLVNTTSLVNGLLNLFLAKPFGSKNLLQRLFTEASDIARTEKQIKDMKRHIPKKVIEKIENWIAKCYEGTPFGHPLTVPLVGEPELDPEEEWKNKGIYDPKNFLRKILENASIFPPMQELEIQIWMSDDHFPHLQKMTALMMRRWDKEQCIELLGNPEMIQLLKIALPLIYTPIFELYSYGDLPHIVDQFFKLMKNLTKEADEHHGRLRELEKLRLESINVEFPKITQDEYMEMLAKIKSDTQQRFAECLQMLETELFFSIRKIALSPKSQDLEDILNWAIGLFHVPIIPLDVNAMVESMPIEHREQIRLDMEAVIEYKTKVKELKRLAFMTNEKQVKPKRPTIQAIPTLLLPKFVEFVKQHFYTK